MIDTTYQKIPGPFRRDEKTHRLTEEWSSPELEALGNVPIWNLTEKVDGTNIRVIWDGFRVSFAGRSDNAQIPPHLLGYLQATFGTDLVEELFEQKFGSAFTVLYGEGYGAKIQNGGNYRKDAGFVLFDVVIGGLYLSRSNVEDIAGFFNIQPVPLIMRETSLTYAINAMRHEGLKSEWGDFSAEGLVATTSMGLLDRRGKRLIVKLKLRDFPEE